MTKRQYSDNDKATALAVLDANGGNVSKTARETKIPPSTITEWRDGRIHEDVTEIREVKRSELSDLFEAIAYKYLTRASDDTAIKSTTGKDAIIAAATATDKMRLLRGLPTEIVALMPEVIAAINKLGKDPVTIFHDIIRRANQSDTDRPVD